MTYNVFGGTLNLAQAILSVQYFWYMPFVASTGK